MGRGILRRMVILPLLATGTLLASAGAAPAESGPPGVWAAAAQYVEMIPTSTGPKAAGAAGRSKPLPKSLARQFARRGGHDAQGLQTLVTPSGWGATTSAPPPKPAATRDHTSATKPKPPPAPQGRPAAKLA